VTSAQKGSIRKGWRVTFKLF